MSKIINLRIDLTKIDKSKIYNSDRTGAKYLDCTVFLKDEADAYGQFGMITQDVTKDERESGEKGAILGNVRRVFDKDAPSSPKPTTKPAMKQVDPDTDFSDNLPF